MKKTLSVSLVIILLLSMITPIFAVNNAGEKLKELNILTGDLSGDLMAKNQLKRQDVLVILIRMLGLEDEAKKYEGEAFEDVVEGSFYYSYVGYAKKMGLTNGIGKNKFGFNNFVSERQVAKFMLNALGYNDTPWDAVFVKSVKFGIYDNLSPEDNDKILRERVFDLMYNTLYLKPKNQEKILIKILQEKREQQSEKKEEKSDKFEVIKASADSLKHIELKFSQKLDKSYLTDNSITIKNTPSKAYLTEDGQTVKIVLNSQKTKGSSVEVILSDIFNEDRTLKIDGKVIKLNFEDKDTPKILNANWLDSKTILVTVSEPIRISENTYKEFEEIKLDGKKTRVKVIQDFENNLLYLMFSADKQAKSYELNIDSLSDYAGKKTENYIKTITLDKNLEPPKIIKAEMIDNETLKVKFSLPVYQKGLYRIGGNYDKQVTNYNNLPNEFLVKFNNNFGTNVVQGTNLEYKGQKNSNGNAVNDWASFSIKFKDDTALPTVDIKPLESGYLKFTFSKPMRSDLGIITLFDKKGKEIKTTGNKHIAPFIFKSGSNDRVLLLEFPALKNIDGEKFKVRISDMKDKSLRKNPLVVSDVEFDSYDQKPPTLLFKTGTQGVKLIKDKSDSRLDILRFIFSESIQENDLKNLSNYVIEDSNFGPISSINGAEIYSIDDDGKAVSIYVPKARNIDKSKVVRVLAMKDLKGNIMKTTEAKIFSSDTFYIRSIKAVGPESVEIKFSEPVGVFDSDAFILRKSSDEEIYLNSYEIKDDLVIASTNSKFPDNIEGYLAIPTESYNGIRSVFMDELKNIKYIGIQDAIRPYVKEIVAKENQKFEIHMSREVQTSPDDKNIMKYIYLYDKNNNKIDDAHINITASADKKVFTVENKTGFTPIKEGEEYIIKVLASWDTLGNQSKIHEETVFAR